MLLLPLIAFILRFGVSATLPDSLTLLESDSQLNLELVQWNTAEAVYFTFSFETRAFSGRIATVTILKETQDSGKFMELAVDIQRRNLVISLSENDRQISAIGMKSDVTGDKSKHQLIITLDLARSNLVADLYSTAAGASSKTQSDTTTFDLQGISVPDELLLLPVFGKPTDADAINSVVGCISDLTLKIGSNPVALTVESQSGTKEECTDACTNPTLNTCSMPDICRNMFTSIVCECIGTDTQGNNCEQEASSVSLDGENAITMNLNEDLKSRHPLRIALSFRAIDGNNEETQTLLEADVESGVDDYAGQLRVTLSNGILTVALSRLTETSLPVLDAQNWNELLIVFDYVDSTLNLWLAGEFQLLKYQLQYMDFGNQIHFGGCADGENETCNGLSGCLKEVYVDYSSVLFLLKEEDSALSIRSDPLWNCDVIDRPPLLPLPSSDDDTESETIDTDVTVDSEEIETIVDPTADQNMDILEYILPESTPEVIVEPMKPEVLVGEPVCQENICENNGKCLIAEHGYPACLCPRYFGGSRCQIPLLARSCSELHSLGNKNTDVYLIDVDGSEGSIKPNYVLCRMTESDGFTIVGHNIPNNTMIRNRNIGNSIFRINYKLMSDQALSALKINSGVCQQTFRYDCMKAPLNLGSKTWFGSPKVQRINKFSGAEGQCSCKESSNCVGNGNCNCDSNSATTLSDTGIFSGDQAGINSLTVIQHGDQGWGKISLGELNCSGVAERGGGPVTFRDRPAVILAPTWSGNKLELWFKTSDPARSMLLRQRSTNGKLFQVWIQNGHVVEFEFSLGSDTEGSPKTEIISHQRPLNNDKWHRVLVQQFDNELRLSVDNQNSFYLLDSDEALNEDTFDEELELGGSTDGSGIGFIGSMKDVFVDGSPVNLESLISQMSGNVSPGTQSHCDSNPCMNLARCLENYVSDTYTCECKNKWAHFGPNCQHNANDNTDVSFHKPSVSYIKYQNLADSNPVEKSIVFSFRTDQPSALMMYSHDQYYNFVQIHLWDERKISLTTNYNSTVRRCTVELEQGDYSNMDWTQVAVNYTEHYTQLVVNEDACSIPGSRILSDSYISQFTEGTKYVDVNPPRNPVQSANIEEYTLLYVGGIPKPREDFRSVFYISKIPSFLGCLRGFSVGSSVVDLRYSGQRQTGGAVRSGCTTGCEQLTCLNGGHCTVDWVDESPSTCDCSKTSYAGGSCDNDLGVHVDGSGGFIFDLEEVLEINYPPSVRPEDSFSFAFSTQSNEQMTRVLAILKMRMRNDLQILLLPNQNIEVVMNSRGDQNPQLFIGNFTEGRRHFFFLKFEERKISVTVDGVQKIFETGRFDLTLLDVQTVYLATGQKFNSNPDENPHDNYRGCISNVLLDFHQKDLRFTPLLYFLDKSNQLTNTIQVTPVDANFYGGQCAQYAVIGTPPPPVKGTFPPWSSSIIQRPYVPEGGAEEEGSGNGVGIAIAIIVIIIIVGLAIAAYLYYVKCVKGKQNDDSDDEGRVTLPGGGYKPGSPAPDSPFGKGVRPADDSNGDPEEKMKLYVENEDTPPDPGSPFGSPGYTPKFDDTVLTPPGRDKIPDSMIPEADKSLDESPLDESLPAPPPPPVTLPPIVDLEPVIVLRNGDGVFLRAPKARCSEWLEDRNASASSDDSQSYYTTRGYDDLAFSISDDDITNNRESIGPLPGSPIFRTPSNRKSIFVPSPRITPD